MAKGREELSWTEAALTAEAIADLVLAIAEDAEMAIADELAGPVRWLRQLSADLRSRSPEVDEGFDALCRFLGAQDQGSGTC
ncbi:hypothetical protein NBH00_23575 [Paraconexibacter antarcticus]|uniref:Uncharacterized protein n=1 Tax=Paraconexibacter antarcticus TaxID=2949664 RepID=A0ABY5DQK3_9ACTN|nr:hypothetical protein [Paraconexibacter antarcticus]UTI64308.1 hypothetical protein NBH00_23575 [Paraconexibacter antarcticus]